MSTPAPGSALALRLPWLRARLSRRIAFWIFFNFLVVEAIVLVPSVLRQAERLGEQLREVTNAKIQWLVTMQPPDSPEALLQQVERLQGPSMVAALSGASLYRASSGERLGGFGTAPVLRPADLPAGASQGRWYPLEYAYDGLWGPESLRGADVVLVIRHDDASLRQGLQTYIRNIVLIVLGIASFLTLITMLVMQRLVIGRVLLLHDHLLRSGHAFAEGMPADPESFLIPAHATRRPDELTDVIEAFNRSFERTSDEMERRIEAEAAAQAERDRAEGLLLNILPAPIAEEMKRGRRTIAETHADVTVLFADIVGFTDLSTRIDGDALVALLNRIFSRFDELSEHHGLEKIKTIGDSYMVVGGLPTALEHHAAAVAEMALAMQAAIAAIETPLLGTLALRIGLHSGPVVAGVIGRRKFIYDLWGETVNVASRMESNGEPGRIQLTEATARRLEGRYAVTPRGLVPIKGVGEMATFWLEGPLAAPPAASRQDGGASPAPGARSMTADSAASTPAVAARAQCPYCGVGCGLELKPPAGVNPEDPSWGARGDRHHPSSLGQVCVKGATVGETLHHNRLTTPLWRERISEPFTPITWERAFTLLVERIHATLAGRGPSALAIYGSGQFLSEDYYAANKLLKGALGSNNFDANSRLCMSSAVSGYARSLGSDGPPCCYDDLDTADLVLLIGTNTAECHPVLFQRLLKRKRKVKEALQLVVVDPRATATSDAADLHLAIRPGTDLALLHGLGHLLLRDGGVDPAFVDAHTEGFEELAALWAIWTPERVAALCGIPEAQLLQLAQLWRRSPAVLSLWSMGVNQSVEGSATVSGIVNLHLVSGQIGRPGAGPFSLTGQPNAMGGREAGGLAQLLPGYRSVADPEHRRAVEQHWGFAPGSIAPEPGLDVWRQVEAMERGELDLWWVAATNPLVSLPWLDRVRAAAECCPLVVLSEAYAGTETAAVAHLLLPAAQWSEKSGVMTNSERRVTLCPAFREPPGEARPDWAIFAELGRRLGFAEQFAWRDAAEVHAELVALTAGRVCDMGGLSHGLLAAHGPQQWPFPMGTPPGSGQARLYGEEGSPFPGAPAGHRFPTASGRARLWADLPLGLAEPPCEHFPLVLTVGRVLGHWHTMTRTAHVARVRKQHPGPLLEVHPTDAAAAGLVEGGWASVCSRRGAVAAPVSITERIRPGTVFLPMHWGASQPEACEANRLMHELGCPLSKQPELKAAAVRLEPLSAASPVGAPPAASG